MEIRKADAMKSAKSLNHGNHILSSKAFFRTLRETLIAYSFDIGGLFAGFMVASQLNVFQLSPWAIAIYPAIVSAKGVIGGLLSGRLSTALHIGTIYPRLYKNSSSFYRLVAALIFVTLLTSVAMSAVSLVFGLMFWGITLADFPAILLVVMSTMALGLLLTLATMNVAFLTFKRGLDPDVVVYPIMSTTADIFITLCYVLTLNLFFLFDAGKHALVLIVLVHIILILYILPRNIRSEEFVKTVKESLVTMFVVAFVVNITGTVLKRISTIVQGRKEIYTVYPALIDLVGDVGSVVGSTATTKLALGLLKPSLTSMKDHALQIFSAWTASLVLFVVLAALSLSMNAMFTPHLFLGLISMLFITNIIAVAVIVLLSYAIAILTFQRGLNPDNFVIPLESSLADSLTSIALLIALITSG
ncbi:magnesium transporter [Candidatus Bathyarchaeota archaeon]|nr:magnesium transporter [Candidatus Bathyarchaeota archaeon]